MRRILSQTVLFLITVVFILPGCSKESKNDSEIHGKFDMDTLIFQSSLKGWELYSWSVDGIWNFSVLAGTNRVKSIVEVRTNPIAVTGTDSLKMILEKIPAQDEIFWLKWTTGSSQSQGFSLPDNETIQEIKAFCGQKGLILHVLN